ncbi:GIY-YIG nuclease family protein [Patescibacteria group bacterium]|nr:GIY-YIG nuclease family protein [Patescibacteria group bacterium]MBW7960473.1 GIY-YIG nuclease family protein [Patescibacteria group bacterium]
MFLYLIINKKLGTRYIGITDNIKRRLKEHNSKGKHFTERLSGEWHLLAFKEFLDLNEAKTEERRLKKSKNKKYIDWYFGIERP